VRWEKSDAIIEIKIPLLRAAAPARSGVFDTDSPPLEVIKLIEIFQTIFDKRSRGFLMLQISRRWSLRSATLNPNLFKYPFDHSPILADKKSPALRLPFTPMWRRFAPSKPTVLNNFLHGRDSIPVPSDPSLHHSGQNEKAPPNGGAFFELPFGPLW
jgi:hypothetical protein